MNQNHRDGAKLGCSGESEILSYMRTTSRSTVRRGGQLHLQSASALGGSCPKHQPRPRLRIWGIPSVSALGVNSASFLT